MVNAIRDNPQGNYDKFSKIGRFFKIKTFEKVCLFFGMVGIFSFTLGVLFEVIGYLLNNEFGLRLIRISILTGWLEVVGLIGATMYFWLRKRKEKNKT